MNGNVDIGAVVELSLLAAKMVAQGIKAIMDSKDLTAEQKAQHIAAIMAQQDQDTKDLNAMPLPNVPKGP